MRKLAFMSVTIALLLSLAGIPATAAPLPAERSSSDGTRTLTFDVEFSPLSLVHVNPKPNPKTGVGLGDVITFHDRLLSEGKQVGDEAGSCVAVDAVDVLANCTVVFRVPGGEISAQFLTSPGPAPKPLIVTGGRGTYRGVVGDGTLVEFANQTGTLTLRLSPQDASMPDGMPDTGAGGMAGGFRS
ncbi:MAG: hypothetical protein M3328_14895 [Chloroflexota bacterium]|nr:hypothetical protein [Chloroflexota bacterium]